MSVYNQHNLLKHEPSKHWSHNDPKNCTSFELRTRYKLQAAANWHHINTSSSLLSCPAALTSKQIKEAAPQNREEEENTQELQGQTAEMMSLRFMSAGIPRGPSCCSSWEASWDWWGGLDKCPEHWPSGRCKGTRWPWGRWHGRRECNIHMAASGTG